MITELPTINKHFHAHATRWQHGDIVFLIDGSAHGRAAYPEADATVHVAVEAASVVQQKWNPNTRAFFYGDAGGAVEIDLKNEKLVENPVKLAPSGNTTALAPAIAQLKEAYPDTSPDHPLHIIVISSGRNSDQFGTLREGLKTWLEEPGKQVLFDVVFTTRNHTELARVIGPIAGLMLNGGKNTNPDKPAPNFEQAFDPVQLQEKIGNAINKRVMPENPHQFLLDKVVEAVAKGAPAGTVCPAKAEFKKKPRGQHR